MLHENVRLVFALTNTPVAVKVEPNAYDPESLMVKSPSADAISAFCDLLGLEHGKISEGPNYFRTSVSRKALIGGMQAALSAVFDTAKKSVPKKAPSLEIIPGESESLSGLQLPALEKCSECGSMGGLHWAYCPNHQAVSATVGDFDADGDLGDV